MARGSYQAGSVSVNLNANSAQYVQALKHAQQITNACLSNMSQTFKHFASTAMQVGATVGRVTAQLGAPLVKSAALGAGALATYTGVVIAHRLEQQKLAVQYGATAEQMNQMAYVANYAGVELEDVLDAMKEFSIKAGDAVEAGEAVTNTMSAFYKAAGGAQMWNNETSPVVKLNKLREAFQKLSDSDKLRVLDEAGDAGLRLNGVLRLTNQEMDMLQKTGAATATAANMTNMQTLIAKFGYLQQVGNDFLMGIVGRIAPVLIKVVDQWTNRLRSAFEDKGGFKEGFQGYVDLWSKRIFEFLMETIESVAKFMDTLSNIKFDVLSAYNNVKATMPGYSNVSATYDPSKLSKEQLQNETKLEQLYKDRDKIDRERIAREKAIRAEYIKTHGAAAGLLDIGAQEYQIGNLVKEDKALQRINKRLEETRTKIEPLAAGRLSINAAQAVDRKDNEYQELAKNKVIDPARAAFEETMRTKPKDEKVPEGKPRKGLTNQVHDASQSAANASSTSKLNENWEAYKKKLEAQKQEVQQILEKYNTKEISEIEKREQEETKTLNDAYKGMKFIVTDYYTDKLKTLNKNSPAYVQATKEMNDKVKAIETERVEAVRRLDESQQKRRITDLNRMTKDIERKRKDMERQYGYGEGSNETEHERGRREIGEQYDEMLDEMRDKFGKHLDDKNSMEYKKFVELQEQKKRAQEEYDKAELDKFWEQQTSKNTIGNMLANMKGSGESPFPGTSQKDIKNAKGSLDEQVKLSVTASDTILNHAAKNNKKAFEMKKKMDIATAIMATFTGATEALKWGWPMGPIFAGLTVAMGMINVAQIRSQQWTGQAHDGIDYVPNEGTWNLQKGERVLGPALNQDMTRFLKANKDNNFSGRGSVTNHYTTHVEGNVLTNSDYETALIERNAPYIYALNEQYRQDRGL